MKNQFKTMTAFVLALLMALSSFAAPTMVGTVTDVAEADVESEASDVTAEVAADINFVGTEEVLLKEYSFNSDAEGWTVVASTGSKPEYLGGITADGYYEIYANCNKGEYPDGSEWLNANGTPRTHVDCRLNSPTLDLDTSVVTKVEVRFNDGGNGSGLNLYYKANDMTGYAATEMLGYSYTKTTDWVTAVFNFANNENLSANWAGKLTGLRVAVRGSGVKDDSVYVDSVKIYGYESETYEWLPGYNLLTGTKTALGFENYAGFEGTGAFSGNLFTQNTNYAGTMAVLESPVEGETGNYALALTDLGFYGRYDAYEAGTLAMVSSYPTLSFASMTVPEDGRPVLVKAKTLITNTDDCYNQKAGSYYSRLAANNNINATAATSKVTNAGNVKFYNSETAVSAWSTVYTTDDTFAGEYTYVNNSKTYTCPASTKHTCIQVVLSFPIANVKNKGTNTNNWLVADGCMNPQVFFDDIMYVPYYKVTFMNGDEELGYAWVLDDGKGNILESFNIGDYDDEIEMPAGKNAWSLTKGGEPVDSIALENKDIVVYATFEKANLDKTVYAIEFDDNTNLSDYTYARISYHALNDGKLVAVANIPSVATTDRTAFKYDSILNFKGIDLVGASVNAIEVRAKFNDAELAEETTFTTDENGESVIAANGAWKLTDTADTADGTYFKTEQDSKYNEESELEKVSDTLTTSSSVNCYFKVDEGSTTYYTNSIKTASVEADEDGYRTYTFNVADFGAEEMAAWNSGNITFFRFDFPAVSCAAEIDYIRFYGNEGESFAPTANAPEKRGGVSLRVDSEETTGVRFMAAMKNTVRENKNLTEYGWIVALAPALGANELTHAFSREDGKLAYVEGKAYSTADKIDKIFDNTTEPDYTIFTAVVVGIPVDKADIDLVVRPYSIVNGAYVYGQSRITSPRAVGQAMYDAWIAEGQPAEHMYLDYQEYIDSLGITK